MHRMRLINWMVPCSVVAVDRRFSSGCNSLPKSLAILSSPIMVCVQSGSRAVSGQGHARRDHGAQPGLQAAHQGWSFCIHAPEFSFPSFMVVMISPSASRPNLVHCCVPFFPSLRGADFSRQRTCATHLPLGRRDPVHREMGSARRLRRSGDPVAAQRGAVAPKGAVFRRRWLRLDRWVERARREGGV